MKKFGNIFLIIILSTLIFVLGFSYDKPIEPYTYYQVYLDGKLLGYIESKEELENYINKQGKTIKNNVEKYSNELEIINNSLEVLNSLNNEEIKDFTIEKKLDYILKNKKQLSVSDIKIDYLNSYKQQKLYKLTEEEISDMQEYVDSNKIYTNTNKIYVPNGIEIKKTNTYSKDVIPVRQIYKKIISKKSPTIAGYKFTIKTDDDEFVINVTDKDIFEEAIDNIASIFIGANNYENYKNGTQNEIVDTGTIIEKVYLQEDVNYRATNISVDEPIYTDATELSKFLLYGDSYEQKKIVVKSGDSISKIAYDNKISVNEFLISNPEYTSIDNLLYEGKEVTISKLNPQINIVTESHSIIDVETNYGIVEQYDSNMNQGNEVITQEGEKGLERVTQNVKALNGQIVYIEPVSKETIKSAVSRVITVGTKRIPTVGSTSSWGWPTNSGYTITSYFQYRFSPINGSRELHTGLDIAGTGYGSPIYATNNGTVESIGYNGSYGNHIIINHGNGYWTLYAHMSRFNPSITKGSVVARGNVIGFVGATGAATGPHVHYEIRKGCGKYSCVTDPLQYYQ